MKNNRLAKEAPVRQGILELIREKVLTEDQIKNS
jgi:hypothetical protein